MSSDAPLTFLLFAATLTAFALTIVVNVKLAKKMIMRWGSNSTVWFMVGLGGSPQRQLDVWKSRCGFTDEEARVARKYQWLCVLEMFLGFLVCFLLVPAIAGWILHGRP
jgi:hypothetical protein